MHPAPGLIFPEDSRSTLATPLLPGYYILCCRQLGRRRHTTTSCVPYSADCTVVGDV